MLRAKAEMKITIPNRIFLGDRHFRPVFNFGAGALPGGRVGDILLSGQVSGDQDKYYSDTDYNVDINFFTVTDEAYTSLKPLLKKDMGLVIQEGSRIIGIATLLDYKYEG